MRNKLRRLFGLIMAVGCVIAGPFEGNSDSSPGPGGKSISGSRCNLTWAIAAASKSILNNGKAISIAPEELQKILTDGKPGNDPFVLSVRDSDPELPAIYAVGHILGATHIPWRQIFKKQYLEMLPMDKQIVVYSYNGHTGGQVAALLRLLSYDAVSLLWGMTGWTSEESAAPGRFVESKDCKAYRIEQTPTVPTETFALPAPDICGAANKREALRKAAENYFDGSKKLCIFAQELFPIITDTDPGNDPFIISIRSPEDYAKGHIPAAVNLWWKTAFLKGNLRKLPPERRIVVYGYNGQLASQVSALLNLLGYDCVNLMWGMTSWTHKKQIAPRRYNSSIDCKNYYFVKGVVPAPQESTY